MNIYGASKICMNIGGASNICVNICGAQDPKLFVKGCGVRASRPNISIYMALERWAIIK